MVTLSSGRRADALFDKYPLSGRRYTTRRGTVVPDELVYFDGEMAHLYGECANRPAVEEALRGSGYRPVCVRYPDGRDAAVGQIWCSRFTDTTIGAYSATFLVLVVVPTDAPGPDATIAGHSNGLSSAAVMLRGTFDARARVYENGPRLFMVRLIDTTQVAIDVGRERMGTDKRPGTTDLARTGDRLRIAVADGRGHGVISADLAVAPRPAFMQSIADAARAAGVEVTACPAGTEYVYPCVARIGRGPVVRWTWHTDVMPSLHAVSADDVRVGTASEEGGLLRAWGFTPRVLGYIPHVRGVITGLAPARGGPVATAAPAPTPGWSPDPRLTPMPTLSSIPPPPSPTARWPLATRFLGTMTATLRKESIGATPDGLRINWHVTEGRFAGPGIEASVLPGAADWMQIRPDGIGMMNVRAILETAQGARVHATYVGHCEFGADGYARALRGDFGQSPPVAATLTFATADPQLSWLNRIVAIGVGRVDVAALRIEFDVHAVSVGEAAALRPERSIGEAASPRPDRSTTYAASAPPATAAPTTTRTLYERMGGRTVIGPMAEDFIGWVVADDQLGRLFTGQYTDERFRVIRRNVVDFFCRMTGGDCVYRGRDMRSAHAGLGITEADWKVAAALLIAALTKYGVRAAEQREFMGLIEATKPTILV